VFMAPVLPPDLQRGNKTYYASILKSVICFDIKLEMHS
jgi:hypothetical protein